MKITNNIISIIIAVVMFCMIFSNFAINANIANADDSTLSGSCGEAITWSLDESSGVLTITGSGEITDYEKSKSPWYSKKDSKIKKVIIEEGITSIGSYAFYNCTNLTSVEFPSTLTTIGDSSFYKCTNLVAIVPYTVEKIQQDAFMTTKTLIYCSDTTISNGNGSEDIENIYSYEITTSNNKTNKTSINQLSVRCSKDKIVIIPPEICGMTVTKIEKFDKDSGAVNMTASIIPSTVNDYDSKFSYFTYTKNSDNTVSIISVEHVKDSYSTEAETLDISSITSIYDANISAIYLPVIEDLTVTTPSTIPTIQYEINTSDDEKTIKITKIENNDNQAVLIPDSINGIEVDSVDSSLKDIVKVDSESHTHNLDDNQTCKICFQTVNAFELKGYSISLSGNIEVNFYMELDKALLSNDAYMEFNLPNTTVEKVSLADATYDTTTGYYIFSCGVAAKEMTDTINAKFVDGDNSKDYTYSVYDYAGVILNSDSYNEKTKNLVKAMLDYGAKAQTYFDYNTDNMANKDITAENDYDLDFSDVSDIEITDSIDGLDYYGTSLLLKSKIVLRHYFKLQDEYSISDYKFGNYDINEKDGYYYVDISDISALNLDKTINLVVTSKNDANSQITIAYSPLNYIEKAYNNENSSENLKSLVKSLYYYHKMAVEYTKTE